MNTRKVRVFDYPEMMLQFAGGGAMNYTDRPVFASCPVCNGISVILPRCGALFCCGQELTITSRDEVAELARKMGHGGKVR